MSQVIFLKKWVIHIMCSCTSLNKYCKTYLLPGLHWNQTKEIISGLAVLWSWVTSVIASLVNVHSNPNKCGILPAIFLQITWCQTDTHCFPICLVTLYQYLTKELYWPFVSVITVVSLLYLGQLLWALSVTVFVQYCMEGARVCNEILIVGADVSASASCVTVQ